MDIMVKASLRQCDLVVYDTGKSFLGEKVYCVVTELRCYGTRTVRFGSREQMKSILRTYRMYEQADAFMKDTEGK